jgi:hypothetical protein
MRHVSCIMTRSGDSCKFPSVIVCLVGKHCWWQSQRSWQCLCHVLRTGVYIASSPPLGHHHSLQYTQTHPHSTSTACPGRDSLGVSRDLSYSSISDEQNIGYKPSTKSCALVGLWPAVLLATSITHAKSLLRLKRQQGTCSIKTQSLDNILQYISSLVCASIEQYVEPLTPLSRPGASHQIYQIFLM